MWLGQIGCFLRYSLENIGSEAFISFGVFVSEALRCCPESTQFHECHETRGGDLGRGGRGCGREGRWREGVLGGMER